MFLLNFMPADPASLGAPCLSDVSGSDPRVTEVSQLENGREKRNKPSPAAEPSRTTGSAPDSSTKTAVISAVRSITPA